MTTPEPELNVEADLGEIVHALAEKRMATIIGERRLRALIQQVSDQKVAGFAGQLRGRVTHPRLSDSPSPDGVASVIDQALANYLSHKETRDGY